jgi:penicillin amidase
VIGYTRRIAWGITNAFFDTVDEYAETVTPGANGGPDTVLFRGAQVPIQTVVEHVPNGVGGTIDVPVEIVPHHGPLAVQIRNGRVVPRTGGTAVSVRWVGHAPTREIDALVGLMYAQNVREARAALANWGTPAMNFVFADVEGNVAFSSRSAVPIRQAGARTWSPDSPAGLLGTLPCGVLPGTGEAEWDGYLDESMIPWAEGSDAHPFFVTANNDQAGVARDNNPLNDPAYLACKFAWGWRAERITERLTALGTHVSVPDMVSINADQRVLAGGRFRPFIDAAIAHLEEERATPGTHPDLTALSQSTAARAAALRDARARLAAWSLDGADGSGAGATDAQRADSAATLIFHAWLVRFLDGTFGDEIAAMGVALEGYATDQFRTGAALWLLEHPELSRTLDRASGQSAVWDDLRTTGVRETRDFIVARALDEALTQLAQQTGSADVTTWRWGTLHTLRFDSMVPGPGSLLSVPRTNDPMFPNGFPRGGGIDVVNASEPGTDDFDFAYHDGPSQRFIVDMDPTGPRALNALPGGEVADSQSRHHRDEAELWRAHTPHPIPLDEVDVAGNAEARIHLDPSP